MELVGIIPNPSIVQLDSPGETQSLAIQGYYSDGVASQLQKLPVQSVGFVSSDESIVSVTPEGLLTALDSGGVEITVSLCKYTAEVPVLVWDPVRRIPPLDPDKLLEISDDGTSVLLNRLLARLKPGHGPAEAEQLAALIDGEVIFDFSTFSGYVIEFDAHTMSDLEGAIAVLEADERVEAAYPDITLSTNQGPPPVESLANMDKTISYLVAGMGKAWLRLNSHDISFYPVVIFVLDM